MQCIEGFSARSFNLPKFLGYSGFFETIVDNSTAVLLRYMLKNSIVHCRWSGLIWSKIKEVSVQYISLFTLALRNYSLIENSLNENFITDYFVVSPTNGSRFYSRIVSLIVSLTVLNLSWIISRILLEKAPVLLSMLLSSSHDGMYVCISLSVSTAKPVKAFKVQY